MPFVTPSGRELANFRQYPLSRQPLIQAQVVADPEPNVLACAVR
jgi:hypothetical protein